VEGLAAVLAAADGAGAAVVPWGGGRHMALGNAPARYDLALRTTQLGRVLEHEPADLTVTVQAGITFAALRQRLAERGQFLPIDAPAEATVGGVLAAGVSGPSRHAYGLPRDWLIGCTMVRADGTIFKGGGRVVKNVAGYDLPKLAIGSLGTLGVIVEATFKLAPLPPAQETLLVRCGSLDEAARATLAADERSLALRAVACGAGATGSEAQAAFWLAGPHRAVERTRRELIELCGATTERLDGIASSGWWLALSEFEAAPHGGVTLRASLPPSKASAFLGSIERKPVERGLSAELLAYPTTGLALVRADARDLEQVVAFTEDARRAALEAGGSLVVALAPLEVSRLVDAWGPAEALPLMRRLKEQFDPRGTLNPGRFVGGI
jgi:glycolate oxidase FAD binding subunit